MAQQIVIIGLGQFGMSLARTFSEKGAEVLAIDSSKELVDEASAFVAEAIAMDATDSAELARIHPEQRDVAICAIGDESKEASILSTALLRQLGAPLVIARANDKTHRRILQLVGAHQVINLEEEFGNRFAHRLLFRNVIADTPIGGDLLLTEISLRPSMVGRTLVELELPKRFGMLVAAIRRGDTTKILQPSPTEPLQANDRLVVVSSEAAIAKLAKEV